jgi:peroxiredoxin Q/BCP
MAQLRRNYQKFVDREAEIVAVGPETPESFADWWRKHQMPFVGIGDPKHVIANKFGQKVKLLKLGRMPAQFVIDKEGKMRNLHYGESMQDIMADEDVLALLDEINKERAGS